MYACFAILFQLVPLLFVYAVPFRFVYGGGSFKRGVMLGWALSILHGFLLFVISAVLLEMNAATKAFAVRVFPEMFMLPLVMAIFGGWFHGFLAAALAETLKDQPESPSS